MAYVYRHIRLDKNIPFYIGVGVDSDGKYKRACDFHSKRRSIVWNKIHAKSEISVDILMDDISVDFAKEKEREFIKLYGRKDTKTGVLINKTDGGDALPGLIFTEEHRRKLSDCQRGRIRTDDQKMKLRAYRLGKPAWNKGITGKDSHSFGRKLSLEHIEKLSKDRMGDKNPVYGKRGCKSGTFKGWIIVYKDDKLMGEYEGIYAAAKEFNLSASKISACLHGRRNHTHGYTFKRRG